MLKGAALNLQQRGVGFIFCDEADRLFSAAEQYAESYIRPQFLYKLLDEMPGNMGNGSVLVKRSKKAVSELAEALLSMPRPKSENFRFFDHESLVSESGMVGLLKHSGEVERQLNSLCDRIQQTSPSVVSKAWMAELKGQLSKLSHFNRVIGHRDQISGISYSPVRHQASLFSVNPHVGGMPLTFLRQWMKSGAPDSPPPKVGLTSATLANHLHHHHDFSEVRAQLYISKEWIAVIGHFSPVNYGEMEITLSPSESPHPFTDEDTMNPEWLDRAAEMIHSASMAHSPTLVLTGSFTESKALARRLAKLTSAPVTCHEKGQTAGEALSKFYADRGVLISPSMWEGVSLSEEGGQFIKSLVITRIPFAPISRIAEAAHLRRMTENGYSEKYAKQQLYVKVLEAAVRRLKQGIGRGIRGRTHRIALYIADPRFTKGFSEQRYSVFHYAVPSRFHPITSARIWDGQPVDTKTSPVKRLVF